MEGFKVSLSDKAWFRFRQLCVPDTDYGTVITEVRFKDTTSSVFEGYFLKYEIRVDLSGFFIFKRVGSAIS